MKRKLIKLKKGDKFILNFPTKAGGRKDGKFIFISNRMWRKRKGWNCIIANGPNKNLKVLIPLRTLMCSDHIIKRAKEHGKKDN